MSVSLVKVDAAADARRRLVLDQVTSTRIAEALEARRVTQTQDAGLGVSHIWTAVSCPAYATLDGADCTCQ